ncbi:H/ACA ribonucleoprotein complex subunit 1 [Colletotrichum tofieldiae]|nr:H/ACA ribonucleoprotein complex subunit 1 [Colletotrichum tofieldiae]
MSFGRGAPRGRGGGGFGGRGGGGFGEMGKFMHACEGEMVCESINPKVPHFNAQIFLENKTAVGKIDEVLGPINQVYFTIKPSEGIQATSFKEGDKFYIGSEKLLPLEKFLPKPKPPQVKRAGRGGPARGGRGGRGGFGGRGGAPRVAAVAAVLAAVEAVASEVAAVAVSVAVAVRREVAVASAVVGVGAASAEEAGRLWLWSSAQRR